MIVKLKTKAGKVSSVNDELKYAWQWQKAGATQDWAFCSEMT